jgi:tRNA U54 and U55 pseudouridine synthase Pus10
MTQKKAKQTYDVVVALFDAKTQQQLTSCSVELESKTVAQMIFHHVHHEMHSVYDDVINLKKAA